MAIKSIRVKNFKSFKDVEVQLGNFIVHRVARDTEGFSTITKPADQEDVKVFLQNEIGLEGLFGQDLLHNQNGVSAQLARTTVDL